MTKAGKFETITQCGQDPKVLDCNISMGFPSGNPYNLVQGDAIVVRAFAFNAVGRSQESALSKDPEVRVVTTPA